MSGVTRVTPLVAPRQTRVPHHRHPCDAAGGRCPAASGRRRSDPDGFAVAARRDDGCLRRVAEAPSQRSGGRDRALGLSQADEGVRAGDRRQAVERRAARRGRQRRVLPRRSGDDAHLVDGREPDVLDEEANLADRSLHDVRPRRSLAAGSRSSAPVDVARAPTRSAPAPTPATACWPTSTSSGFTTPRTTNCGPALYAGAGLYFDNHINIGVDVARMPRQNPSGPRRRSCSTARRTDSRSTRRRRPARAWTCCGTRATASSTRRAAGWPRPATARRSTVFSAPTRAGSG